MDNQLKKEVEGLRNDIQGTMNRLSLVIDGLEREPNAPEPFTVQGASVVLRDTLKGLDGILANIHEGTELSKYLDRAGRLDEASPGESGAFLVKSRRSGEATA